MRKTSLIVGLAAVLLAAAVMLAATRPAERIPAFTLRATQTVYKPEGAVSAKFIYRRASNGDWRSVVTRDGRVFNDFSFFAGRGSLTVDYGSRTIWRDPGVDPHLPAAKRAVDVESLTSRPDYAGTDTILGRTAYHFATKDPGGSVIEESWVIPELGNVPVKWTVYVSPGRLGETQEPYELVVGEPDADAMRLPDFPQADRAAKQ